MSELDLFGFLDEQKERVAPQAVAASAPPPVAPAASQRPPPAKPSSLSAEAEAEPRRIDREELGSGSKRTIHETVYPEAATVQPPWSPSSFSGPAKKYPYPLDPFQACSVSCLERGESVLVSAHTSAGKTAVAEYAVALALRAHQRVIYTAPIKALSNQKYRDLQQEFGDVGLMTGDTTISPHASCLVMTTEILRNMLYRGNEILREVAWVVFDEVHYMRDNIRGVVWEESIIMLPDKVRYVFLSATIPNGSEFASWVCDLHRQVVHVISTEYRPTPLKYYVFKEGGDGAYLVMDERKEFLEQNYARALQSDGSGPTQAAPAPSGNRPSGRAAPNRRNPVMGPEKLREILNGVMTLGLGPIIVFSFSRKICESHSKMMSLQRYTSDSEQAFIRYTFNLAVQRLSDEDRELPQIQSVLPLLENGVAMHHSGLLPIVKEIIETLFSARVIKILFATETFAMGVNMPAKTVIFTKVDKFDGESVRMLTSGEYIQMSGRAGRRGMDKYGVVIQMLNSKNSEPSDYRNLLEGTAAPLNSSFYVAYNMVLNLVRLEGSNPDMILRNSFFQFQNRNSERRLERALHAADLEVERLSGSFSPEVETYWTQSRRLASLEDGFWSLLWRVVDPRPFLVPGRLVRLRDRRGGESRESQWCCLLRVCDSANEGPMARAPPKGGHASGPVDLCRDVEVVMLTDSNLPDDTFCVDASLGDSWRSSVFPTSDICGVSCVVLPLAADSTVASVGPQLRRKLSEGGQSLGLLHPVLDMHVKHPDVLKLLTTLSTERARLNALHVDEASLAAFARCEEAKRRSSNLRRELDETSSHSLLNDVSSMKQVLERLGYLDASGVITIKGKLMCDLTCRNEILVTEMIFENLLTGLDVAQTCALLTVVTSESKAELARGIVETEASVGLEVNAEEYISSLPTNMVDVVYRWALGESSLTLFTENPELFEGAIVKTVKSTEDLLRKLCAALKLIGNHELEDRFTECSRALKRDIAFLSSLYVDSE